MKKICFAASSGGHFEQLLMLKPLMKKYDSFILTEKTPYKSNKEETKCYYLNQINRKEGLFILKFILEFFMSLRIFIKEKPDAIISTGALITVPMCVICKVFKKKVIYIESFAKIKSQTLSGKIVYKFADLFIVQWDNMLKFYPKAINGGSIY
ncbi:PssD/Cps14F family polysaccharide biosynthesis glycosyltransferase [Clostridium intestinale]|jgi:UDP-N-acetylglucosamine:LPS N-acetylglucosamine transferase|uniref:PssD/Cps14F family polysaccharide biosynthesis glycosyltransferase n=1 Tax=Clostridium intestinale TaxID=36845 RepID=UPI0028EB16B2|nr:PssD/Cps14F family polysaccharide biosynthesis glycosyltransferase [Clostridium intestinale]